jgi:ankyrin repeat protein
MFEQLITIYENSPNGYPQKKLLLELDPFSGYTFMDRNSRMRGRALCMGAALGDPILVRSLLRAGVDVRFQDYIHDQDWANSYFFHLLPPLMNAALAGHERIVSLLLSSGATIGDVDESTGLTALHIVAYQGEVRMGKYLLEHGANIESRDYKGRTPLHCATYGKSRKGGRREANMPMVKLLVTRGAVVEALDENGATPLHTSVYTYQEEATQYLLEHGASVHTKRGDGTTVVDYLHRRWLKNWWFIDLEEIFCILLKHGAFQIGVEGSTPLHNVVKHQNGVYVKIFLGLIPLHTQHDPNGELFDKVPADPDFKTEFPNLAAIDINARDDFFRAPLHYAALGERHDILEVLLEQGADPNAIDRNGNSPLHYASQSLQGLEGAIVLLKHGGDVNTRSQWGDIALHLVTPTTVQRVFKELTTLEDEDEEFEFAEDWDEERALYEIEKTLTELWDLLLGESSDNTRSPFQPSNLNARNLFQETPLHLAAEHGNTVLVKKLLDKGVSAALEDRWDCTALDIAIHANHQEVVTILESRGCQPSANGAVKCTQRKLEKEQEILHRQEIEGPRWKPKRPFKTM